MKKSSTRTFVRHKPRVQHDLEPPRTIEEERRQIRAAIRESKVLLATSKPATHHADASPMRQAAAAAAAAAACGTHAIHTPAVARGPLLAVAGGSP